MDKHPARAAAVLSSWPNTSNKKGEMENLFSLEYGVGGACVLLTIMILIKVAEFLWKLREKRETVSEQAIKALTKAVQENTIANQFLELRMKTLEGTISEVPKMRNDLRRFYAAIKELAGPDKWLEIRDQIMKDDFSA